MENTTKMIEEFIKKQKYHNCKATLAKTSKGVKCVLVQTIPAHVFRAYVVEDDKIVNAGILTFSHDEDIASNIELSTIEVKDEYRNQGIGSVLVKKFISHVYDVGNYKKIKLISFSNTAEFFEKFGFKSTDQKCVTADDHRLINMDLALAKTFNTRCEL